MEELPLWATPVATTIVLLMFEAIIPFVLSRVSTGTAINYGVLFIPFSRLFGALLAVGCIGMGLKGAARRCTAEPGSKSWLTTQTSAISTGSNLKHWWRIHTGGGAMRYVPVGVARHDGGVDLEFSRDGQRRLVHVKHWTKQLIGVRPVSQLWGVVTAEGATGGVIITATGFTHEAIAFAAGTRLELIDAELLQGMMTTIKENPQGRSAKFGSSQNPVAAWWKTRRGVGRRHQLTRPVRRSTRSR